MKYKCALLIGALAIISALLIIKPYNVSAFDVLPEYQSFNDTVNGSGFWWKNYGRYYSTYNGLATYTFDSGTIPLRSYFCSTSESIPASNQNSYVTLYCTDYVNLYITSNNGVYTLNQTFNIVQNDGGCYCNQFNSYFGQKSNRCQIVVSDYAISGLNPVLNTSIQYYSQGTLEYVLNYIALRFRNVTVYLDGYPITVANGYTPDTIYGIMNTNKGLKVNGADFSFYTSYNNNKFTIAYNYTLTNRDNSDSNLRIDAGDLLTFELYAKVPTKDFIDHYISENGLGDATPSILIDVARQLKTSTNIINTSSIPTTTVYGLNYYGYNDGDAVEYDDSYYNFEYGNDQNGILTFRVTSDNNSADSPNLLARLVQYYGSERGAILGSAMGYIDYCRSYVVNISGFDWKVYNPYYTYFFQVKDESGRNVIRANSFEGTPQQFNSNDVSNGDNVGNSYAPSTNQSDIENSYTGGITNSYNSVVNNYYNTSEANQELLDYLYRYRDGGQQEDIQNAYGYLNSTIDSVSNVPVVIGKLFYGFFPPEVILLFNAMFIIFAVFIIIKIIRHLFL